MKGSGGPRGSARNAPPLPLLDDARVAVADADDEAEGSAADADGLLRRVRPRPRPRRVGGRSGIVSISMGVDSLGVAAAGGDDAASDRRRRRRPLTRVAEAEVETEARAGSCSIDSIPRSRILSPNLEMRKGFVTLERG